MFAERRPHIADHPRFVDVLDDDHRSLGNGIHVDFTKTDNARILVAEDGAPDFIGPLIIVFQIHANGTGIAAAILVQRFLDLDAFGLGNGPGIHEVDRFVRENTQKPLQGRVRQRAGFQFGHVARKRHGNVVNAADHLAHERPYFFGQIQPGFDLRHDLARNGRKIHGMHDHVLQQVGRHLVGNHLRHLDLGFAGTGPQMRCKNDPGMLQ